MKYILDFKSDIVWLLMIVLTLFIYVVGGIGLQGIMLLLTTVVKGVFVIRYFMELKDVSLLWRVIMYGWLWLVCSLIAITYVMSL